MLQLHDELIPDSMAALNVLSAVVCERLIDFPASDAGEVVREFGDEFSFLSMSFDRPEGQDDPSVRVEFGVQDSGKRLATGAFVARWLDSRRCFGELELILLSGEHCDAAPFVARLGGFLELPASPLDAQQRHLD